MRRHPGLSLLALRIAASALRPPGVDHACCVPDIVIKLSGVNFPRLNHVLINTAVAPRQSSLTHCAWSLSACGFASVLPARKSPAQAGWVTPSWAAARVKLPSRTTVTKESQSLRLRLAMLVSGPFINFTHKGIKYSLAS